MERGQRTAYPGLALAAAPSLAPLKQRLAHLRHCAYSLARTSEGELQSVCQEPLVALKIKHKPSKDEITSEPSCG